MLSAGDRGLRDENDAHYRLETDKHTRKQICKAQWKVKKPMYMLKKKNKKNPTTFDMEIHCSFN